MTLPYILLYIQLPCHYWILLPLETKAATPEHIHAYKKQTTVTVMFFFSLLSTAHTVRLLSPFIFLNRLNIFLPPVCTVSNTKIIKVFHVGYACLFF